MTWRIHFIFFVIFSYNRRLQILVSAQPPNHRRETKKIFSPPPSFLLCKRHHFYFLFRNTLNIFYSYIYLLGYYEPFIFCSSKTYFHLLTRSHYVRWNCLIPTWFIHPFFYLELFSSNLIHLSTESCLTPMNSIYLLLSKHEVV